MSTAIRIRQLRHLDECRAVLADETRAMLALELAAGNAERVLDQLATCQASQPSRTTIVLAERGLESYEWPCRELGAVAFTCSPRQVPRLSRLVHRYFDSLPREELDLEMRIRDRLPWGAAVRP